MRLAGACGSCDVARELATEKARLAAWLAHELRTPLNCVLGYAELLCEQLALPGRRELLSDAERVRDLALHQLALLDDVLDLARLEHGSVPFRTGPVDGPASSAMSRRRRFPRPAGATASTSPSTPRSGSSPTRRAFGRS
ncbi:MAG: hypothetical protein IPP07_22475 [Holophagales bacterium]|nr:hypothetical protein [Holophagales bacterium]